MATSTFERPAGLEGERLSRWRVKSPFMQSLIACLVVFLVPGMNSTLLGLGAGGSHPSNITIVDKTNIAGASITIFAGILGGSINNKIGPRYTLMIAASSYPFWAGSLWWLDQGGGTSFAYVAAVYHGIGAGLFYSTSGFILSSYSTEGDRGKYLAAFWASASMGSAVSASIVLGIASTAGPGASRVPSAVYITIVVVECVGFLCATLIANPSSIKRNDGKPIAVFKSLTWVEEITALSRNLLSPKLLLLAIAFFASNMPVSLGGSLNAFSFNARTRALVNLNFNICSVLGYIIMATLCDAKFLGHRRQRAFVGAAVTAIFLVATYGALFSFLTSNDLDRSKKSKGIDWNAGGAFSHLFIIYSFFGCCYALFQGYAFWVCYTFSNEPAKLSHFNGFVEGMRALGYAVSFGIDSHATAFLSEAAAYFALLMVGLILSILSAGIYMTDSSYGREEGVVIPKAFVKEDSSSTGEMEN